jgi:hypothetical protein
MHARFRLFLAGFVWLLLGGPVGASEAKLETALAMFHEAALWRDNTAPDDNAPRPIGGIVRLEAPLRLHLGSTTSNSIAVFAEAKTREAAAIAGLQVVRVENAVEANFRFDFFAENAVPPGVPPQQGCGTGTRVQGTALVSTLHIRIVQPNCVAHEILHGLGLLGHPHEFDTLLSYKRAPAARENYTELDRLALRTLYGAGMAPGTFHLPALLAARQFMAEELGLVAKGGNTSQLARPVLDAAVARLRAAAAGGARQVYLQLGFAYEAGHYVAVDPVEAVRFWELAAGQRDAEGLFRLGLALQQGKGTTQDEAAARRRLREASALGHGPAAFVVAQAYRDGRGGWPNAVEAYAFFDLAARRNVAPAAAARDALFASFDPATRTRAQTQARQFPTAPPRPAQ